MERELLITVPAKKYGKQKLLEEIIILQCMIPKIESYRIFKSCHEVFDFMGGRKVRNPFTLRKIFRKGTTVKTHQYLINLN